jgi:basic amino acid/polyamine antiporter, APA family
VRALAGSEFPLVEAAGKIGDVFGIAIAGAALVATANAVLSSSLSGSRLLFGMARAGDLPHALTSTLGKSKSPWVGALVVLAIACIFGWFGEIEFVASLSSLGVTLVFATINTALIVLRYTKPDLKRPFKVPSIGRLPITAVLGAATSLLLASQYHWTVYVTFAAVFAAGMASYVFVKRSAGRA